MLFPLFEFDTRRKIASISNWICTKLRKLVILNIITTLPSTQSSILHPSMYSRNVLEFVAGTELDTGDMNGKQTFVQFPPVGLLLMRQ